MVGTEDVLVPPLELYWVTQKLLLVEGRLLDHVDGWCNPWKLVSVNNLKPKLQPNGAQSVISEHDPELLPKLVNGLKAFFKEGLGVPMADFGSLAAAGHGEELGNIFDCLGASWKLSFSIFLVITFILCFVALNHF